MPETQIPPTVDPGEERCFEVTDKGWARRRLARRLKDGKYVMESSARKSVSRRALAQLIQGGVLIEVNPTKVGLVQPPPVTPVAVAVKPISEDVPEPLPPKKKRGRPKGSKSKGVR